MSHYTSIITVYRMKQYTKDSRINNNDYVNNFLLCYLNDLINFGYLVCLVVSGSAVSDLLFL